VNQEVAFFLPSLGAGGAEKCMLSLGKGMAAQKLDVSLLVSQAEGPYVGEAAGSLRLVDLKSRSVWKSIPRLVRYLRRERPGALISALEHADVAAWIAKQISAVEIRTVVSTHTMVSLMMRVNKRQVSNAMLRLIRLLYPRADHVVAVSRAVASDLSEVTGLPEGAIRVIHNPVEAPKIFTMSRAPVNSTWFRPNEPPVVIAVGSLWPHKDQRTLIEAFSIARRSRTMRLVILGEGPQRPVLEKLLRQLHVEKDVLMPGFVENPYCWMAKSNVFVLPSRWEGLPTVLVEAMACGLPAVATDCPGGTSEILEGGRYGCLTPVGNAPAMAEAMLGLLDRPLDPATLRKRAEDFSLEKAVAQYFDLVAGPAS